MSENITPAEARQLLNHPALRATVLDLSAEAIESDLTALRRVRAMVIVRHGEVRARQTEEQRRCGCDQCTTTGWEGAVRDVDELIRLKLSDLAGLDLAGLDLEDRPH